MRGLFYERRHSSDYDDFVYCVISDDGPGVPPESLERLMRPFYRVDSSRTNPQEGSGLGLSIIRRIIEIF